MVQTDIHYPTDGTLLWDAVRVLSRLLVRLGKLLERRIEGFRNRTRAARRRMQAIQRMSATQRRRQQTAKYRELIAIAEAGRGLRPIGARGAAQDARQATCSATWRSTRYAMRSATIAGWQIASSTRRAAACSMASKSPTAEKIYLDLRAAHRPDQARQGTARQSSSATRSFLPRVPEA